MINSNWKYRISSPTPFRLWDEIEMTNDFKRTRLTQNNINLKRLFSHEKCLENQGKSKNIKSRLIKKKKFFARSVRQFVGLFALRLWNENDGARSVNTRWDPFLSKTKRTRHDCFSFKRRIDATSGHFIGPLSVHTRRLRWRHCAVRSTDRRT